MYRWLIIALLAVSAMPAGAAGKQDLHLFVPCGMIVPITQLKADFQKKTHLKVDVTYDNGVTLVRRIRDKGERPDILLSPGELECNQMVKEGFVDPKSVQTFGTFKMILVVPKKNPGHVRVLEDLAKPEVRHIIIAQPDINSVGYYAQQSLKRLAMWDKLKSKIVTHWHAQEAVDMVCSGRADAGLFYESCPFDSAPEKVEGKTYTILSELPQSSYPVVKVQAGMLKGAKHKAVAQQFLRFLMEPASQKTLAKFGIPNFPAGRESR